MSRPGVPAGNDSVEDDIGAIFAVRPLETLGITVVLDGSVRNGNLDIIAAASIVSRPEFGRAFYTKHLSAVVCDPASTVGYDWVLSTVNLKHRQGRRWMEPSRKRNRDRTANRSNRRENAGAMSGQIVTEDCAV
jgi:hypothetical protein